MQQDTNVVSRNESSSDVRRDADPDWRRALEEAEAKFRTILDHSRDAAYKLNLSTGTYEYVSPSVVHHTGFTPEEVMAMGHAGFQARIHPDDREQLRATYRAYFDDPQGHQLPPILEYRFQDKQGNYRWIADGFARIPGPDGRAVAEVGSLRDATGRKRNEESLARWARISKRLCALMVSLNACRSLSDIAQPLLDAALEMCGMDAGGVYLIEGDVAVLRHHRGLPPDFVRQVERMSLDLPGVRRALAADTPENLVPIESEVDGSLRAHGVRHAFSIPLRADEGAFGFLNVVARAVDPDPSSGEILRLMAADAESAFRRIRIEEALRRRTTELTTLLDTLPGFAFFKDMCSAYIAANETFCRAVGTTREQAPGKNDYDFFPPELADKYRSDDKRILSGAETMIEIEEDMIDGGRRLVVATRKVAVKDEAGRVVGLIGLGFDITDRKRAEEARLHLERQMLQTQKLESLGVLAGGIAHDFNNLLTAILGHADLALQGLSPSSSAHADLDEIVKASRRAADLCRQMLAYSGKGRFVVESVDLNEVVQEMARLLKTSISKKAVLSLDLATSLAPIDADPSQIRQVLMNLIINASEAIGEQSGRITVSTRLQQCDMVHLRAHRPDVPLAEGAYVRLDVSDTGCGMDAETRNRIFEPFFTTKFTGRGLGLPVVLGIVRGHKGAIKLRSDPGQGAKFSILLPIAAQLAGQEAQEEKPDTIHWRGSGTVLLVDDEEAVRALAEKMLERLGFSVIMACDGCEAVELYRRNRDEIACVLLDLTMPNKDGEETLRELRRLNPRVPILLSSGYTEEDVLARFVEDGPAGFVQKPYELANLRRGLRHALTMMPLKPSAKPRAQTRRKRPRENT